MRDGEAFRRRLDDQRRDDGQRQRDLDGENGALAGGALQVDGAADLLDVGPHHVHANAPARDGGDSGGGGEAGAEDEALDLRFRHRREFRLGGEAVRQHLGADLVGRETAAVVGDLDNDVAALMEGVQCDASGFRLPGGAAFSRVFQPVIAAVADHVGQRILDQFQHLTVEFGIRAEHG